jgi:hypothetical protein
MTGLGLLCVQLLALMGSGKFWREYVRHVSCEESDMTHVVCPKSNENDLKFFLLNIHAITVYPLQNRLLVIEYSDSSVAPTLHNSGGSLHLRCCSKPSSQLTWLFQLSLKDVFWGGFCAWGIKINRTEPSQGCTGGGEALWYYVEPKIPSQWMMCDLAHCRGEGTSFAQIFLMCRSSVMIRWTSDFGSPT